MTKTAVRHLPVGQRIRWARERKGISQERLAAMVGTSRRHMIRVEKGQHMPGARLIARIAEATEHPEKFFKDDADEDAEASALRRLSLDEILRLRARDAVAQALAESTATEPGTA